MSIGENIRNLREKKGISQKELAEAVGVTDKAVSTWELDINTPRMGVIEKLSQFFKVQKSEIIENKDSFDFVTTKIIALSEIETELIIAYRNNPEMQEPVNKLLGVEQSTVRVFRAARSDNNAEPEIKEITKKRLQEIKNASETDEDL